MKKIYIPFTVITLLTFLLNNSFTLNTSYEDYITGGMTCVLVQHEISDFDLWAKAFEADKERQSLAEMSIKLVCQSSDNPNSVSVVIGLRDVEKAKAFFADPKTAELMGAAGVTSPPSFTYFKVAKSSIPKGHSYMIVQHDVADYKNWRKAFDAHEKTRSSYDISVTAIGSQLDDKNKIIAIMNSDSPANFKDFFMKSDLKEVMKNSGVTSEPVQHLLTEVK